MTTPGAFDPAKRYDSFVDFVLRICDGDPARRAALRSGLGRPPEQAHRMHAVVTRWVAEADIDSARERAYYAVASLIAAQGGRARGQQAVAQATAEPTYRPSLGTSLGRAAGTTVDGRRAIAAATAEKRLHLLVRQGVNGVHRHLPPIIRQLRGSGVTVDWAQLIHDLARWDREQDRIAKKWLQDYYRIAAANSEKDADTEGQDAS